MRKKNRRTSILGASGKRADGSRGSSCGMIALCNGEKRRCPEPPPEWMTCAPPQNRKTLVPDFAERHAKRLVLGFVKNAILKERDNEHQKMRRNGFYQVRNTRRRLLSVSRKFPQVPMLPADDVIDSGWGNDNACHAFETGWKRHRLSRGPCISQPNMKNSL